MSHWRKRQNQHNEVAEALAKMLFAIVCSFPFLAVWLGYVLWKVWA